MLLRIRGPSGTYKVRCEPNTTYAELVAEVEKQCEWAGEVGALRLSLNKKDQLELEQECSIGSAGIRGGDLLYIIADAGAITRAAPPVVARPAAAAPRQTSASAAAAAAAAAERRAAANSYTVAAPTRTPVHRHTRTTTVRYPAASDMLVEMGFSREQSDAALGMCDGNAERAVGLITSGALGRQSAEGATSASGADDAMDSTDETEEVGKLAPPPRALQLHEVYNAVRDALLHVMAEAGFEEHEHERNGRHTYRIAVSEGLCAKAIVQLSTLGEYVNVHAMAWEEAPVHLLTYGGPGTALGFSLTDLLCELVTEWKRKVVHPMLLELSLGAMLRAAATTVPAELLAVALHSVMLSNGFDSKIKGTHEGAAAGATRWTKGCLPLGWNLGGGNFSFEYTLGTPTVRPDVPAPSILVKAMAMGDRLIVHAMVEETTENNTDMQQEAPPVFDATFSIREHISSNGLAQLQPEASAAGGDGFLTLAPLSAPDVFAAACSTQLLGKLLAQISPPPTLASLPLETRVLICTHLPLQALGRAARICKDWRSATLTPSVWRCCLARDFPSALAAMQAQSAASAPKDGHRSEGEDWRQLYKLTRLDAERERKRKAEAAERRRRQIEMRGQFPHRPEIQPSGPMPQPLSGGGNWGIPGRNPLMAGGDYDRMPHLPAVPGGGLMIPGSGNIPEVGGGGFGTTGGIRDILPGGDGGGFGGIPLPGGRGGFGGRGRGGAFGGRGGRGGGMGGFQPMGSGADFF